jgi:hypothetical protein
VHDPNLNFFLSAYVLVNLAVLIADGSQINLIIVWACFGGALVIVTRSQEAGKNDCCRGED